MQCKSQGEGGVTSMGIMAASKLIRVHARVCKQLLESGVCKNRISRYQSRDNEENRRGTKAVHWGTECLFLGLIYLRTSGQ
jgi:hypothetical protein